MKFLEKFNFIFLVAGLGLLVTAFITLGLIPAMMTKSLGAIDYHPTSIPDEFKSYYENLEDYEKALYQGRDIYIKEACWHCHSQYVRPVGNEALRYGPVSVASEYDNSLNLPQLFGTRRVGPDLSREGGKRPNDWHFVHLYNPKDVVPLSIMPSYSWYFNKDKSPKPSAVALVAYLQWLGSQLPQNGDTIDLNASTNSTAAKL
ncbi:MAG: cbb3-type cytochrome c oxidase subunit II [Verrucomicrobia bacterium]|nr:cbb3-type cytochrome c oxidase subunit II [Verrucomicrobiota bacterium]